MHAHPAQAQAHSVFFSMYNFIIFLGFFNECDYGDCQDGRDLSSGYTFRKILLFLRHFLGVQMTHKL